MTITYLFVLFILYSFSGWLWETLLYVVRDHRFVNRGFLFGPICPIYGCGAILCAFLLYGRVQNPAILFLIGTAVCSILEYGTHWALEKLFGARWWDYTATRFNINGRICLQCSAGFGFCIMLLIDLIHPFMLRRLALLPLHFMDIAAFAIYTLFVADMTLTVTGLIGLKERLKALQTTLTEHMQRGIDQTEEKRQALLERFESSQLYREQLQKLTRSAFTSRFVLNFPRLKSPRYQDALVKVKEKLALKR